MVTAEDSGIGFTVAVRGWWDWGTGSKPPDELSMERAPNMCSEVRSAAKPGWKVPRYQPTLVLLGSYGNMGDALLVYRVDALFSQDKRSASSFYS